MSFSDFKELEIEIIDNKKVAELSKFYPSNKCSFVKVGKKKWHLLSKYSIDGHKLYNFEVRSNDIWIVTYPRSGTTLTQELTWLVANDLNFDEAQRTSLLERFPFIETNLILEDHMLASDSNEIKNKFEFLQKQRSPRFIKTHMPLELLPTVVKSDCKIIYVARNPRDVMISWYHLQKDMQQINYEGTFEQFCDLFLTDQTLYCPYWEHVKEGWTVSQQRSNTLFLFYEDLKKNLHESIKKIAAFCGKSYSDEQIKKLEEHLSIEKFRKNPMVNKPSGGPNVKAEQFIRQGKIDGWKEVFTSKIEERFNKWIYDNLKDTDLAFPY